MWSMKSGRHATNGKSNLGKRHRRIPTMTTPTLLFETPNPPKQHNPPHVEGGCETSGSALLSQGASPQVPSA
jgi:hypothetical protein